MMNFRERWKISQKRRQLVRASWWKFAIEDENSATAKVWLHWNPLQKAQLVMKVLDAVVIRYKGCKDSSTGLAVVVLRVLMGYLELSRFALSKLCSNLIRCTKWWVRWCNEYEKEFEGIFFFYKKWTNRLIFFSKTIFWLHRDPFLTRNHWDKNIAYFQQN